MSTETETNSSRNFSKKINNKNNNNNNNNNNTHKILNVQQHHFVHHVHFPQLQYKYMVTTHLSSICKLSPAYSFDSNLKVAVFVNIAWAKVKQITCNYSL